MSETWSGVWAALPPYEEIPGFGLYMDQLVGFVDSCFAGSDVESLTPGMINSYVKNGMVTRPVNKKYSRESIAQLLIVSCLKRTSSMEEMRKLLNPDGDVSAQALYEQFISGQRTMQSALVVREDLGALDYALAAALMQNLCRQQLRHDFPEDGQSARELREAAKAARRRERDAEKVRQLEARIEQIERRHEAAEPTTTVVALNE